MKIGIITLYNAANYGAYLQAYCLQEVIKRLSNNESDVRMIKTSSFLYEKTRFTSLFSYNPRKIPFKYRLLRGYLDVWKKFRIGRQNENYDLVIVGSDEMWNLKNITVSAVPQFFGEGIKTKHLVTYAVSCNNTNPDDVRSCEFALKGVKNFENISVRDQTTYDTYSCFTNKHIRMDLDPTFLVDIKSYVKPTGKSNYILVYTYGFENYMIGAVKNLAKSLNKKIIMVGQNYKWVDETIPADAFEFLSLINDADLIITDTFHGTVLSIGLNKQVLIFADHKPKVKNIIEQLNLSYRNVSGCNDLLEKYHKLIDYNEINKILEPLKTESLSYLSAILEMK